MIDEQIYQELQQMIEESAGAKYDCAGLYSISIGDVLVYIGKSTNIKNRLIGHMSAIMEVEGSDYKSHKYKIMREAQQQGLPIIFDKIYECLLEDENGMKEDIGFKEGAYIRKYRPYLNYQIPKEHDYRKFSVNKTASTITLNEIMGKNYKITCNDFYLVGEQ